MAAWPGHTFIGLHEAENSYFHRAMCAQDYSAVTAACLMVKKSVFEEVGGLTEELAVAFNDVDFCLKVRAAGYLVVYAPYAVMHHYESKSRGLEDTPEKVARFNREWALVAKRWPDILTERRSVLQPEPDTAQVRFLPAGSLKREDRRAVQAA
ncbi:MAG: glycosyltransferase family 2 protein [Clostridium sp.]